MGNMDDFRSSLDNDEDETPVTIVLDDDAPLDDGRFLGMNAGERAFLSVMLFLASLLLGAGVLIVTGRVVI